MIRAARRVALGLLGAVLVDLVAAVVRDLCRPPARVVTRHRREDVREPRPLIDHVQLALVWSSVTGSRVLCRVPAFMDYLRRLTLHSGDAMDAPDSRKQIDAFIRDNGVDLDDLDRPIEEFATLNDFFARSLRAGARPIASAADATVVMPADCRVLCSPRLPSSEPVAVKAYRHDIYGLLGAKTSTRIAEFYDANAAGGFAVATCRLAPGDYHRFHWPVDAWWDASATHDVLGEYHSVSPAAVSSVVDVLGRNRRKVIMATSEELGDFAIVIVGALKVGSILLTGTTGAVRKGDELGLFKYGGSTVVLVFAADRIDFDADLLDISETGAEALVRMGESLGRLASQQ